MRYSSLDAAYLARLDDFVLMHTAAQYHNALAQIAQSSTGCSQVQTQIRVYLAAVMSELERRGLDARGWHIDAAAMR